MATSRLGRWLSPLLHYNIQRCRPSLLLMMVVLALLCNLTNSWILSPVSRHLIAISSTTNQHQHRWWWYNPTIPSPYWSDRFHSHHIRYHSSSTSTKIHAASSEASALLRPVNTAFAGVSMARQRKESSSSFLFWLFSWPVRSRLPAVCYPVIVNFLWTALINLACDRV